MIQKMLNKDKVYRATISELLEEPYIIENSVICDSESNTNDISKKIISFVNEDINDEYLFIVDIIGAYCKFHNEDNVIKMFKKQDTKRNGFIQKKDLTDLLYQEINDMNEVTNTIDKLMNVLDNNKNYRIDFLEFSLCTYTF